MSDRSPRAKGLAENKISLPERANCRIALVWTRDIIFLQVPKLDEAGGLRRRGRFGENNFSFPAMVAQIDFATGTELDALCF